MSNVLRGTVLAVALLAALASAVPALAREGEAMVRVAHLSPDAPNVDVYVNGELVGALTNVPFKTVSSYLPLPAGTQNVKVYPAGDTSKPIVEADVDLRGGEAYTIGIVGLVEDGSLEAQVYEDDRTLPAKDEAKLRVIHAAPDVDAVDISSRGGDELFADLGFPNATAYAEIPPGTYTLEAEVAGTDNEAFIVPEATLSGATVYSVFAVGQAKDATLEVVVAEDAGASGESEQTAYLDVVPGTAAPTEPVADIPDTGGISPALLLFSAVALIVTGLLGLRRHST